MRVKRGVAANKRRKNLLKHAKGFKWRRKSHFRAAKEALFHAWSYAYRDRRTKKQDKRRLWQTKINAASRTHGVSYSRFISAMKNTQVDLYRKILADLAENNPTVFEAVVKEVTQ